MSDTMSSGSNNNNSGGGMGEDVKKIVKRLDDERRALEMEAECITMELTTPKEEDGMLSSSDAAGAIMGLDAPLVDADGFPRGDIDVHRARTLRHRLAILRTDHKRTMKEMEHHLLSNNNNNNNRNEEKCRQAKKPKPKLDPQSGKWVVKNWDGSAAGLEDGQPPRSFDHLDDQPSSTDNDISTNVDSLSIHSSTQNTIIPSLTHTNNNNNNNNINSNSIPFAIMDAVDVRSPAHDAGFQEGDLIVKFGPDINHSNHSQLKAIANLVPTAAANKQPIPITILRNTTKTICLPIIPQPWAGRGLLGCHIRPYTPHT